MPSVSHPYFKLRWLTNSGDKKIAGALFLASAEYTSYQIRAPNASKLTYVTRNFQNFSRGYTRTPVKKGREDGWEGREREERKWNGRGEKGRGGEGKGEGRPGGKKKRIAHAVFIF
jgi:hypothetical protein